ncbi:hypothetical protein CLOP_g9137 [Closterium sp. NIES-67]|nr:hypothetical protein CLOP_g9137 [Closterium sp. NIES-67]
MAPIPPSSLACLGFLVVLASTLLPSANAVYATFSEGINSGGGACNYEGNLRDDPLFNNGMTAMIPHSRYENGKGCGTCYEVECLNHASCRSSVVTVRAVGVQGEDFLLSDTAWDEISNDRSAGRVEIRYRGVDCPNNGGIAVKIMPGSNPYWFAIQVLGAAGAGGVDLLELSTDGENWTSMSQLGNSATWTLNPAKDVVDVGVAVNLRVTLVGGAQQPLVWTDAIPVGWSAGTTYHADGNF